MIKIALEFVSKGPINNNEALSPSGLNASIQKHLKNGFGLAANQKPGFQNSYLTNMDFVWIFLSDEDPWTRNQES